MFRRPVFVVEVACTSLLEKHNICYIQDVVILFSTFDRSKDMKFKQMITIDSTSTFTPKVHKEVQSTVNTFCTKY